MATARSPAEEARNIFPDPQAEPRFWDLARWQQEEHEKQLAREAEFWRRMGRSGRRAVIFGSRAMDAMTGGVPNYLQAGVQYATALYPHQAMLAATGRAGHIGYRTRELQETAETERLGKTHAHEQTLQERLLGHEAQKHRLQLQAEHARKAMELQHDINILQEKARLGMGPDSEAAKKRLEVIEMLIKNAVEGGAKLTPDVLANIKDYAETIFDIAGL